MLKHLPEKMNRLGPIIAAPSGDLAEKNFFHLPTTDKMKKNLHIFHAAK
jgi:hypothetical protein